MAKLTRPAGLSVLALALLLALAGGCRHDDGGLIRINPKSFDAADEAAIGRRLLSESWRNEGLNIIEADNGAFTDQAYVYLRGLTRALVEQGGVTRRDSFEWDVTLVLDEAAHAYVLPGGKLVLHTGLLHALDNEAECVGILAREIALAEQGAAMSALDRQVDDNVTLGDIILGNVVPLDHIVEALPQLTYTTAEVARADSLAARLVCPSDYEERALPQAVQRLGADTPYRMARVPTDTWASTFESRVSECVGADSLYRVRYQGVLERSVPN